MMKKWIMVAAMALGMVVTAQQAQAGSDDKNFTPYIGIGGGVFAVQYEDQFILQRNPTWGTFVKGGIDINNYIGTELRLGLTGNPATDWAAGTGGVPIVFSFATKIDNFVSYLVKIGAPLGNSHVHAFLGGTTAKASATVSVIGLNFVQSTTKTGFTYGLGYDFNVSDSSHIGIEWMEYWTNVKLDPTTQGSFRGLSIDFDTSF